MVVPMVGGVHFLMSEAPLYSLDSSLTWRTTSVISKSLMGLGTRCPLHSLVQGAGVRVQGSGCRVQGSGFRVQGSGFRVWVSGFRVAGTGVPRSQENAIPPRATIGPQA